MIQYELRYEITHEGTMLPGVTALSSHLGVLIRDLFTQYGWTYSELSQHSAYHEIRITSPLGEEYDVDLFAANIRNEKRSPYEKKIQLNREDPRKCKNGITLILGFYVAQEDDDIKDAIIVGYPVDEKVNYGTNPSIRGVFVNEILLKAKNNGVCVDKVRRLVGFRPEFIFYYLMNYAQFHGYADGEYGAGEFRDFDAESREVLHELRFNTGYESDFSRNRILFGAPGTGKSYTLNHDKDQLLENGGEYERVTFHPDYSYANFVGTYKPVPCKDDDGKDAITYEYVPGPFMRIYVKALKNSRSDEPKPYLLLIEEINRANVAAVFGDVFQLLDRDQNISEYPIRPSEDIKKYLAKPENLGGKPIDYDEIKIPDNMFIWATMNSADQGVFPMDTAFKRRWEFTYLGIDDNEKELIGKTVKLGRRPYEQQVEWNELRKAINQFLADKGINEDKQLGPYFISRNIVVPESGNEIDSKRFIDTFKNKVIMYLFEDAAKQKRSVLFEGCTHNSNRYSEICKDFDTIGADIFCRDITKLIHVKELVPAEEDNHTVAEEADE